MTQGQNSPELAQLRDIHSPEAIGWWPLAPGWYLLAIVLLVILMAVIFFFVRRYSNGRARRQALKILATYQQQHQREMNGQLSAARVSELLKRVALVYYPRADVASLTGDAWLRFLSTTAKGLDFNSVRQELLEAPYQSTTDHDLQPLFNMARLWINQRRGPCSN